LNLPRKERLEGVNPKADHFVCIQRAQIGCGDSKIVSAIAFQEIMRLLHGPDVGFAQLYEHGGRKCFFAIFALPSSEAVKRYKNTNQQERHSSHERT
jgi:hypothetical protein